MDPQIRRELRRQENEGRRSAPVNGPVTIGARSELGTYDVTFVDGSAYPAKGVKVFNTAHSEGDTVVGIPRQDGFIALEGPKARPNVPSILDDPCGNYLGGQIFSCPQPEEKKPIAVWALADTYGALEPDSPVGIYSTYLINLITGVTYFIANRPRLHPGCSREPVFVLPPCYEIPSPNGYDVLLYCPRYWIVSWTGPLIPQFNHAFNTLSLDAQGRPIVRITHTVACPPEGQDYDFKNAMTIDRYFRLESENILEYPGGSIGANLLGDWRFDTSVFEDKEIFYDNPYISPIEPARTTRYNAAEMGLNIVNGAPRITLEYNVTAMSNSAPFVGRQQIQYPAIYRGNATPARLNVMSIAIRRT